MISLSKINSYILFLVWAGITLSCLRTNGSSIAFGVWIVLLFIGVLEDKKIRIYRFSFKSISSYWFLILSYVLVSTIINYIFGNNYLNSIYQCIVIFLVPYVAIQRISDKCNLDLLLKLFRGIISICCLVGIAEYLFKVQPYVRLITDSYALNNFQLFGDVQGAIYSYRTTLFFYHPIFYSIILGCDLSILLYKPYKSRLFNYLNIIMLFINLILTQSRTGWIVAIVVLSLFVLDNNRSKITKGKLLNVFKVILSILIGVTIICFLNPDIVLKLVSIIVERIAQVQEGNAAGARLANFALVNLAIKSGGFLRILLGGGRNYAINLLANNPQLNGWTNAIDNQYLTFFLDYGIIGVLGLAIFFVKVFRLFWARKNPNKSIVSCIIISIAIGSLFFEFFNLNTIYYLYLLCVVFCEDKDSNNVRGR